MLLIPVHMVNLLIILFQTIKTSQIVIVFLIQVVWDYVYSDNFMIDSYEASRP